MKPDKFYTNYDPPEIVFEKNSGEKKVEKAGYMPAEVQIFQMIQAGQRLGEARKEMFDFAPGQDIDEELFDPTRSPGFDMSDASQIYLNFQEKFSNKGQVDDKGEPVAPVDPVDHVDPVKKVGE